MIHVRVFGYVQITEVREIIEYSGLFFVLTHKIIEFVELFEGSKSLKDLAKQQFLQGENG